MAKLLVAATVVVVARIGTTPQTGIANSSPVSRIRQAACQCRQTTFARFERRLVPVTTPSSVMVFIRRRIGGIGLGFQPSADAVNESV